MIKNKQIVEPIFGVLFGLILTLGSKFVERLPETKCRGALGYLESARSETTWKHVFLLKHLAIFYLFDRLWPAGTRFHS